MVIQVDHVMFLWTLQKFDSQDIAVKYFFFQSLKPEPEAWHLCPFPGCLDNMLVGLKVFIIT